MQAAFLHTRLHGDVRVGDEGRGERVLDVWELVIATVFGFGGGGFVDGVGVGVGAEVDSNGRGGRGEGYNNDCGNAVARARVRRVEIYLDKVR